MSKKLKRITAVLLAVMMVMVMGVGNMVFAEGSEGSITIQNTVEGKHYDLYRIFDLKMSGDKKVAYTISDNWKGFFENGVGANYIVDANNDANDFSTITVGREAKFINITDDNVSQFAQDALDYAGAKNPDAQVTGNGNDVEVKNLPLGYYLVYPEGAGDILEGNGSVCSLTNTKPDATVKIKAGYPQITKEVDDNTVEYGQVITYTVTGQVPDTTGYMNYSYNVSDTMDAGLSYNGQNSLQVTVNGSTTTNYTYTENGNGFALEFDMTEFQDNKGKSIVITYTATVNENAVIGEAGNSNKAVLKYSNNPKDSDSKTENPPVEVVVYTAALNIVKIDGNGEGKLSGAEFVLIKTNEDGEKSYYSYDEINKKVEWVIDIEQATIATTDNKGNAYFKGVESGNYSLEEIKAPDGYNLLTEAISITINSSSSTADVYQTATVKNYSGTELPGTGGIGTKMFIFGGTVLMLAAGIALIARRRMKLNEGR